MNQQTLLRPLPFSATLLVALLSATGEISCTAEPPPNMVYDLNKPRDLYSRPDQPPGCPKVPTLGAPQIEQYPNPTSYALQPFRGSAPGADLVTARGGAGAAQPAKIGSDGKFCVEVTLLPDSPNTITFSPLDANGCPGRDTIVNVTHRSVANKDAGISSVINVARLQPVTSENAPEEGVLSYLNDGDPNSSVKLSFIDWDLGSTCDKFTWLRIDLGKTYTVSKLKVRYPSNVGGDYAVCYTILLSASAAPANPDPAASGDWVVAKQEQQGDATDQVLAINPTAARWAALLVYENGSTGLWETFRIGELEVWGQDPNATPPPPPDRCR